MVQKFGYRSRAINFSDCGGANGRFFSDGACKYSSMIDLPHTSQVPTPDPLFLERLQAFLDKSVNEIQAFSERENRPFQEV
jgi:hypothetical protein